MDLQDLKQQIEAYQPECEQEEKDKAVMLQYIQDYPNVLTRENTFGHFNASSWVVNPAHTKVLMIYHNIYQSWAWTGGHADGEADLFQTAIRELKEETGVQTVTPANDGIYSLEVICVNGHIKRGAYVSSHVHLNLTYLFEVSEEEILHSKPDENKGVKWIPIDEIENYCSEDWMIKNIYAKLNRKLPKEC